MAKSKGGGGSLGGRRGAVQTASMTMGEAKSLQKKGSSKPDLNKKSTTKVNKAS